MIVKKTWAYLVLVMAILWIIIFPMRLISAFVSKDYQLMNNGVEAQALVTSFEPNNHSTLHYAYSVNGIPFQGSGAGENLPVGSSITIHYLPQNPEVSRFGDPANNYWNDVIPFGFGLVVMAIAVGFNFHRMVNAPVPAPRTSLLSKISDLLRKP